MICDRLSKIVGIECYPISDDGSVARIASSFTFEDGDAVPIYLEKIGGMIRFFDDGGVLFHLRGRGVRITDQRNTKPIRSLAEDSGVMLTDAGDFEIWAKENDAPTAFANYIKALVAITSWEREQIGIGTDTSIFLEEVALCLRSWKPNSKFAYSPEYVGISGYKYRLDFALDGKPVLAISAHPSTISSSIKKLLDIKSAAANSGIEVLVVLDDRRNSEMARREGKILDSVAHVLMMSRLEQNAGLKLVAQ